MPGFGKSGTWRISFFSSSTSDLFMRVSVALAHRKSGPACHDGIFGFDRRHPRMRRTESKVGLEPIDGVALAFDARFNAAIGQIHHPAVQALAARGLFGEGAEPDTLDAAVNQKSPRRLRRHAISLSNAGDGSQRHPMV